MQNIAFGGICFFVFNRLLFDAVIGREDRVEQVGVGVGSEFRNWGWRIVHCNNTIRGNVL